MADLPIVAWIVERWATGRQLRWQERAGGQCTPLTDHSTATALLSAAEQRVAALEADARRLDWLERQNVAVRTPLRYGSRECFSGGPDLEEHAWGLRARIDAAMHEKGALSPRQPEPGTGA